MYFDNSDGLLASPFSEVVVTRRAFRSGESEYSINKTPARLRDIRELFRDTGIGKDGYSIIGQGRVSEILSDRSDDRREVFEEAAGVMKYRARKEEAERKLQATAKNILRLEDILRELESRLEPLRLQSEKAAEYFRLREELRELEINLFLYQYDKSNERLQQLRGVARQLSDEIPAALAEEEAYAAGCAKEEELERSLSAAISETSRALIELSASVEGSAGNEKLIHERIDALTADVARRQAEITRIRERETADGERSSQLAEEINLKKASEDALEAALETAEAEFAELSGSINAAEEKLEAQKQSMMDYMNRLADTKSRISRLGAMRESIMKQTASLAQELIETEAEGRHLDEECAEAQADKEALLKHKAEFETARQAAIDEINALNVNALSAAKAIRRAEDEISAGKSRLKVLEEMRRAHEGYYASVRRLLNDAQRSAELKKRMHGVVAELYPFRRNTNVLLNPHSVRHFKTLLFPPNTMRNILLTISASMTTAAPRFFPSAQCVRACLPMRKKTVFAALTAVSALPPSLCAFRPNTAAFLKTFSAERSLFAILTPEFLSADVRNRHFALQR